MKRQQIGGLTDRIMYLADGKILKGCPFATGQAVNRHSIHHAGLCEDEALGLDAWQLHGLVQPTLTCEGACNNTSQVTKRKQDFS